MLVLALVFSLASKTQARLNQRQRESDTESDPRWRWLGLRLGRLPCLYASVHRWPAFMLFRPRAVCSASLYSFHAVRAARKPFNALPSRSASFQTVRPGF